MSLYCPGKLFGAGDCGLFPATAAAKAGLTISFPVDPEDLADLSGAPGIGAGGVAFCLYSSPGDSCATALWNESMGAGHAKLKSLGLFDWTRLRWPDVIDTPQEVISNIAASRLGRFLVEVLSNRSIAVGTIALFDGNSEAHEHHEPGECLRRLLAALLLPWDRGPNTTYTWFHVQ